ncbi:MAG: adenylate kinase family protein [Nitrososphaerota archaeon]
MLSKVITGSPGVGKHTISNRLAKRLNLKLIDINKVAIESGIFEQKNESLDVDVEKLKKMLAKKITKNSLVVGHLAPYVISQKQVDTAVVLRKSPYKLASIYKKRKYSHEKSIQNLGSEILGVTLYDAISKFGSDKTFQIDTTNKSISTVVKKIESLFAKGVLEEDEVDWLGLISERNDIKRFFPY